MPGFEVPPAPPDAGGTDRHATRRTCIHAALQAYLQRHPDEHPRLQALCEHLDGGGDIVRRSSLPGHVTASGIVWSDGRVLLVRHPFLGRWLQPGGHLEADEDPLQAAIREVREETGFRTVPHPRSDPGGIPLDIDVHVIPANPRKGEAAHLHYDFRFLLELSAGQAATATAAELPWQWADPEALEHAWLRDLVRKFRVTPARP